MMKSPQLRFCKTCRKKKKRRRCAWPGGGPHGTFPIVPKINGGQRFSWLSNSEMRQTWSALFVDAGLVISIDDSSV